MRAYVGASAAAKLLVEEPESKALVARLDAWVADGATVLGSLLLETELRRLANRMGIARGRVSDLLDRFDLLEPARAVGTAFETGVGQRRAGGAS
ncbi:MAG: hypothetical protein ABR510_11650 [Trueperaceae bacterium]